MELIQCFLQSDSLIGFDDNTRSNVHSLPDARQWLSFQFYWEGIFKDGDPPFLLFSGEIDCLYSVIILYEGCRGISKLLM